MATSWEKKYTNKLAKERSERRYVRDQGGAVLGAAAGVTAVSLATSKMPRLQSIDSGGRIQTAPVLAAAAVLLGMSNRSSALMGAGLGIGGHWLGSWVEDQSWAQPG